ncbi:MAG: hypothetical protein II155_03550, partial [Clostridia bacterium]|nr:hypothetical protein [Clostridia bacterium]
MDGDTCYRRLFSQKLDIGAHKYYNFILQNTHEGVMGLDIGLVLSGGLAKGTYQLGALYALNE